MFNLFSSKVITERASTDPDQFDDPLAKTIAWVPLKRGGSKLETHKLITACPHRLEFKASMGILVFGGLLIAIGLFVPGMIVIKDLINGTLLNDQINIFMAASLVILVSVGYYVIYTYSRPIIFDTQLGFFWKGKKVPQMYARDNPKSAVQLSDIHAIQIISEFVNGSKLNFYSYELNLVLKSGERVNVTDHGNVHALRKNAEDLSKFLGKPVWDRS